MQTVKKPAIRFNYLYFGFFFILLVLFSTSHLFIKPHPTESILFFLLYAIGQAFLEVLLFVCVSWWVQSHFSSVAYSMFVGITFLIAVFHFLDFIVERVLDFSVVQTLEFVFDESFENFFYLLDASGLPLWGWGLLFSSFILVPLTGVFFYHWLNRISTKKPLYLQRDWLIQGVFCVSLSLLLWEYGCAHLLHPNSYTTLLKALPWKSTFLQPKTIEFSFNQALKPPTNEANLLKQIEENDTVLEQLPNIYLFVIESFREDFISEEVAPHLSKFKQDYSHFNLALSNGNGSHVSWFSIFHSQFPHHWHTIQKQQWKMGSPPLQLLKKWGYQIRLYTSAQLHYYGMQELLFGEHEHLLDQIETFYHPPPITACSSDAKTLQTLQKDLQDPSLQQGQVFLIFWDSTHFDYSWPQETSPKFNPISQDLTYFRLFHSVETIEKIKNRYRNAVFYVDSLFGKFWNDLPNKKESIVIVTGDHGEEFLEQGHLFHGSCLTHQQTHIPLYMKLGTTPPLDPERLASQMDIFPTLLHYLGKEPISFLEGASLLAPSTWPYIMVARFNAGRAPYEFCLHNGKNKLIAQFLDKKNIFNSQGLYIRALWTQQDECVHCAFQDEQSVHAWITQEFAPGLQRILH